MLFSPLPTPGEITNQDGTGYHVNITGYGRSGSGTTGASQGIDWRRRAAENMLGALTSFDERNQFLFGNAFGDLPQSLYRLDFDDPNKTNPFDFNLYKDEPLTKEATTAGGDSGGPLILDAANNSLTTESSDRRPVWRLPLLWTSGFLKLWYRELLPTAVPLLGLYRCQQPVSLC